MKLSSTELAVLNGSLARSINFYECRIAQLQFAISCLTTKEMQEDLDARLRGYERALDTARKLLKRTREEIEEGGR